jgi:hypothetical protein
MNSGEGDMDFCKMDEKSGRLGDNGEPKKN